MAEITVAGKKVVLRDRMPVGEFHQFIKAAADMWPVGKLAYAEQVGPILPIIEAWEFPGDPHDLAAVAELDAYEEFMPLWMAISDHLAAKVERSRAAAKNSDAPPISP